MKVVKKLIVPLFITAVAASLSSCASNPNANDKTGEAPVTTTPSVAASPTPDTIAASPTETPTVTISPTPTNSAPSLTTPPPTTAKLREKTKLSEAPEKRTLTYNAIPTETQVPTGKTVDVTVYTIDSQCQDFVSKKTSVPADEPVAGAVGRVLEGHDSGDFSLSGYRVNVKNGVATVDLRVSPNSKRLLSSLSSCENTAIFGSIRRTLTSNSKWNIKDVRFTEKGEEVVF